jgi:hypothetical protein
VLGELLGQRSTTTGSWVNGIVDGYLAILMVEPAIYVLTALLQDLLAKDN